MPHHKSCIKRVKTSAKARIRNRAYKSVMKTAIKRVNESPDYEKASMEYRKASSILDKLVLKGVIHRNKANNQKSQLARRINRLNTA
ncbi:MAG: 30S ribosomal protein S20 [candidate division Zixibacteria bacterium]|nr:30S ribosomal protein S20 [Candidatus Tariuqbacter arcticus]